MIAILLIWLVLFIMTVLDLSGTAKGKIIRQDNRIFLIRYSVYLPKGSIKIHIILHDDTGEPHSHPWHFKSFLLLGAYRETLYTNVYDIQWSRTINHAPLSLVSRKCEQKHLIKLYKLWNINIPCITIGYYSEKKQLCSLCKELGYCKTSGKKP